MPPRSRLISAAAVLLLAALVARGAGLAPARAQPGSVVIAPSKHVTTSFGIYDAANAVVALPDNRFVVGGYTGDKMYDSDAKLEFALARYLPDGSLDTSFGNGGRVTTDLGAHQQVVFDLALQPDGRLLAAGSMDRGRGTRTDFVTARYLVDGRLDSSFGNGGHTAVDVGGDDRARGIALQPDGRIVLAGMNDNEIALVRLMPDGQVDATFGNGGTAIVSPAGDSYAYDVAVQPDGRIVAVGAATTSDPFWDMVVVRLDAAGGLDASFADAGVASFSLGHPGSVNGEGVAVGLTADGRIQATGQINILPPGHDHHVVRVLPDGEPDPSLGTQGYIVYNVHSGSNDFAEDMVLRPDGSAFLAGLSVADNVRSIGMALLQPDGTFDTRFGTPAGQGRAVIPSPRGTRLWPAAAAALGLDRAVIAGLQDFNASGVTSADFAVTIVDLPVSSVPPTLAPSPTPLPSATKPSSATPSPSATHPPETTTPTASATPTAQTSETPSRMPVGTLFLPIALDGELRQT